MQEKVGEKGKTNCFGGRTPSWLVLLLGVVKV